jgi:hypothetical protein
MNKWNYFYKIHYAKGTPSSSNMVYTPMINEDGNILCMLFDERSDYQQYNPSLTKDLVDFFFEREVKYLTECQKFDWAVKLIDIDYDNRKIFIEFSKDTINHIMFNDNNLDEICPDWKDQLFTIMKDLKDAGYYKMALYPHCFFIKDGKLKAFDFYSCVDQDNPFIERSKIAGMIGPDSGGRFDNATVDGVIDFRGFFKHTLLTHLSNSWANNPFAEIYKKLYEH